MFSGFCLKRARINWLSIATCSNQTERGDDDDDDEVTTDCLQYKRSTGSPCMDSQADRAAAGATAPNRAGLPGSGGQRAQRCRSRRDEQLRLQHIMYVDVNGMFTREAWNCFDTRDRTINACEGYHSMLNSRFHGRHADPFTFIEFLKTNEQEIERRLGQLAVGAPAKKRKSKYVLVDEALDRLRNQYFGAGIPSVARLLQYMDAVAHQLYDVKH